MTTAYYDHLPPQIEAIGNGSYFYRWNIEEEEVTRDFTEETTTQWKCNEVVFEPPMSVDNVTALVVEALGTEDEQEIAAIRNEVGLVVIPMDMEAAKRHLQDDIWAFDKLTEEFTIGEVKLWLNREERQTILRRCDSEAAKGYDTVVLRSNGMKFDLPIETCRQMVLEVEFYASRCYDNREDLLAAASELTTAEEILAFDFTSGYPEKLVF